MLRQSPVFLGLDRFLPHLLFGLLFTGVLVSCDAADQKIEPKVEREESWQVLYMSGQRIGYSSSTVEPVTVEGRQLVRTFTAVHMTIKRFGQSIVMKQTITTEETLDGNLLRYTFETANPPAKTTTDSGLVDGSTLRIKHVVNGKEKEMTQSWRADVKSPTYQDRVLRASPLKPGESREFETFSVEFSKVAKTKIKAIEFAETAMLDGSMQRLLKVNMTQSLIPGLVTVAFIDSTGDSVKSTMSVLGTEIITYKVEKDEALKAIAGAELDLAVGTLIKVKKKIPNAHSTRKIVYLITIPGQNPETVIPSGDSQSVTSTTGDSAEVTVTSIPIPDKVTTPSDDKEFLASTQYLQADDEFVRDHAKKATGDSTDQAQIARKMEKYVNEKLAKKNFSTAMASAGEVARSLEGDCTEHAVLLAAMLRAKGIPSRVAVGLVYVDSLSAFGGHMWTEAKLNGSWVPLDATLGRGGIGAAHLKLSDSGLPDDGPTALSSFAPLMMVIGQLKIDDVRVE